MYGNEGWKPWALTSMVPVLLGLPLLCLFDLGPLTAEARRNVDPCSASCMCVRTLVTCRNGDLTAIPANFPSPRIYTHLVIVNQPFMDKTLRRHNVSYMQELQNLDIKGCGIEALEVGVFSDLRNLKSVDLSDNNIRKLEDNTFRGLNFRFLFLNNNRQLKLSRKAFAGLSIKGLSMQNCGLRSLLFETFLSLNGSLNSLWLSNNQLMEFDPRFETLFGHLETLSLFGNPFLCKCRLRWLVWYLKSKDRKPREDTMSLSREDQPRCASPVDLKGLELRTLDPTRLSCDPPRFGDMEVAMLSPDSGRLNCAAYGYPTPTIIWQRQGTNQQIGRVTPSTSAVTLYPPNMPLRAEVAVGRQRRTDTYECIAYNAGGNVTLTVRLRWPPRVRIPKRTQYPRNQQEDRLPTVVSPGGTGVGSEKASGSGSWHGSSPDPGLDDETNPFFQKKFTLLELIGAVVGTFTATLALFLVICRCITYARKKQKKQQWSTYESAYSGSHVYDVPRHDQASYMAAKTVGTVDRHEFLDFKTGRKVYDHV